jgi:hypothetical protein
VKSHWSTGPWRRQLLWAQVVAHPQEADGMPVSGPHPPPCHRRTPRPDRA